MKSLSKGLTFMNLLFVLASIIQDGETAALSNLRFNQEDEYQDVNYPDLQNPNVQIGTSRISDIKCMEYIEELKYKKPINYTGSGLNDVLSYTEMGGRDAYPGEFPHMGALGWKTRKLTWLFMCGCTLISPNFALTAAHCTKTRLKRELLKQVPELVRFNTNVINEATNDFRPIDVYILRTITHPEYTSPLQYYDIALIEFRPAVRFTRSLHPACLWTRFDMSTLGTKVSSTGWGTVDPVLRVTSSMLQVIEIDTIDSPTCNELLAPGCNRHWCNLREHQLCAGNLTGGIDSCDGDSGGPLQVKIRPHISQGVTIYNLVGVTSFGIGCGQPMLPGVYTRVSSFIDWIECNVWKNGYSNK